MGKDEQELVSATVHGILLIENQSADACASLKILIRLLNNIINDPQNEKFHKMPSHNKTIQHRITDTPGAFEVLSILGFSLVDGFYIIEYNSDPAWLQTIRETSLYLQLSLDRQQAASPSALTTAPRKVEDEYEKARKAAVAETNRKIAEDRKKRLKEKELLKQQIQSDHRDMQERHLNTRAFVPTGEFGENNHRFTPSSGG